MTTEAIYAVRCIKFDGRRVEFKRYTERAKAELDVAGLRRVGIEAELVALEPAAGADAEVVRR